MYQPRLRFCLLFALLTLSAPFSSVSAQSPDLTVLDGTLLEHPAWNEDAEREMAVVVELYGPTSLDLYLADNGTVGDTSTQAAASLDQAFATVAARQAPARAYIESVGARIISTYDSAANGFLVLATRDQIEKLTRAPGVKRIYRAPEHHVQLVDAVPFIGADAVADELGFTGQDVTIAIIDTGIDYTHKSFGGSGKAKDYQNNNPDTVEARSFPTEKVIGGWDFAGTQYNPSRGRNTPQPDPDPLDQRGHGSHVAGISAGATGNAKVYHGVARDAYLIALKVFGASGGTNLANSAIEWAIEANLRRSPPSGICRLPDGTCRVDVINMSLGSPWADGVMAALNVVQRATQAGIVVVASAGNSGNVPFILGSPSAAPEAVSVANTYADGEKGDTVQVTYEQPGADAPPEPVTEDLEALEGHARLSKQMTVEGELIAELQWFGKGCNNSQPEGDVSEKVALAARGTCSFKEKLANAEAAGAVAVLIQDNGNGIVVMGPDARNPGKVQIPAYMIRMDDGQRLRDMLSQGTAIQVRLARELNGTYDRDYLADVVNSGSSRGPTRLGGFKPDISAPGTNIVAPQMGGGDRGVSLSGTSMSGPMVAGAAAVVVERLRADGLAPDGPLNDPAMLGALDVGALLMNYATATVWQHDNRVEDPVPLARQGAGRVELLDAVAGDTLVRAGPIASLNFGLRAVSDAYHDTAEVTIHNIGPEEKRYSLSTQMSMADDVGAGVSYQASKAELTLPAGASETVEVAVDVNAAALKPYENYGGRLAMTNERGLSSAEMDGFFVVTEVDQLGQPMIGGDLVRVPIYMIARPASAMRVSPEPLMVSPSSGTGDVHISNAGAGRGVLDFYALLGEDGDEADVDPRLDVNLVGARLGRGAQGEPIVEIVVHTDAPRLLPLDSQLAVLMDTDRDGSMDWMLTTMDYVWAATGGRTVGGQQVVIQQVTRDDPLTVARQARLSPYYADMNLGSRTVSLPVRAQDIGYSGAAPIAFNAVVRHAAVFPETAGRRGNATRDTVPDDGLVQRGGSGVAVGDGRLEFDPEALAYDFDRWSLELAGGESATVTLSRRDSRPLDDVYVLAASPLDSPDEAPTAAGEVRKLAIVEGIPPTLTPTPTATVTPTPRPAHSIYVPVVMRKHFYEGR